MMPKMMPNKIRWEETYVLSVTGIEVVSNRILPENPAALSEKSVARAMLADFLVHGEQKPGQLEPSVLGASAFLGASFLPGESENIQQNKKPW